jgi:dihydroflavonol-4-reductase
MYEIDTSMPVMVSGATGYVAGWIVKELLDAGVTVHAAVRDPDSAEKLQYLNALAEAAPGAIRYFRADLMEPGSYHEAMAGCGIVFHTASPFTTRVKDPQKELLDPALLGTRNVLGEADRTESVRRVVLTSSCAAIYADAADCAAAPGGVLTEEVWNTTASLGYQPYSLSKTRAEQEAWMIAEAQSRWDLVTINPALVLGPAIGGKPTSDSFDIMRQVGDGTFKSGVPRFGLGVVDVRDVARAHIAAAYTPGAEGRHIICERGTDLHEMVRALRDPFGRDYPIPERVLPKWLVWLVAPMVGLKRRFVARNADWPWRADNSKSVRELGMTYRPMEESIQDMFRYMIDTGYFKKA